MLNQSYCHPGTLLGPSRNRYYEFFKATYYLSIIFSLFFSSTMTFASHHGTTSSPPSPPTSRRSSSLGSRPVETTSKSTHLWPSSQTLQFKSQSRLRCPSSQTSTSFFASRPSVCMLTSPTHSQSVSCRHRVLWYSTFVHMEALLLV